MKFESKLPKGVFTATLTPMNDDLSVNYTALLKHINWLLENGSNGICLMGTTGEANSFSVDERLDILDEVIKAGVDPIKLLVGTGTCVLSDTIILTQHAIEHGVGGVLMLPPFYYKGLTDEGILEYFKLVIEGVNDTRLKIYLYHFPKMTGVPFTLELIKKLIDAHPQTIVGIKDSSGDWDGMAAICQKIPGFLMYSGTERYLLPTLQAGGAGCISATFNASIRQGAAVFANWQTPEADELQEKLTQTRYKFEVTSFISAMKYLFSEWFNDRTWLNMRPPNSLPDDPTRVKLMANLSKEEFFG